MSISVFAVDGRPVRLSRLKACLGNHPKMSLMGAASSFRDALQQIGRRIPDAVVVGGELIELSTFAEFAETMKRLGVVMIPVWVFPFSQVEVDALFGPESGAMADEHVREGDTAFLTETILSAVTRARLENGRAGARSIARKDPVIRPIVIGASTGGVEALHEVLADFPADCPPVLVVQHMRPHFVTSFVEGLDRACRATVILAWDGAPLQRGRIYVAPGDETHLIMTKGAAPCCKLVHGQARSGHRPSVDMLFVSAAAGHVPPAAALLTGMGRDGADGLLAIRRSGGYTVAQSAETCTVYGMPRAAVECGAATEIVHLPGIGQALLRAASRTQTNKTNLVAQ